MWVCNATDFVEFIHEIDFVLHAPRSVDEDNVHAFRPGGFDGVAGNSGGIAASLTRNTADAEVFTMGFQLLDCPGPKRVTRCGDHAVSTAE